jgi:hypothetical protein
MRESNPKTVVDKQTRKAVTYTPGSREYVTSDTGERPPFREHILDSQAYGDAISSFVQKTCDVLFYDPASGRVAVATRIKEPQRGDWVIGGRKFSGESDHETVIRKLKDEMGADVARAAEAHPESWEKIEESYGVVWDSREHPATMNESGERVTGAHQDSNLYAIPVAEATFNAIVRPNKEYSGVRWEDGFDIIESPDGTYHPAFRDMVADTLEQVTRPD